MSTDQLLTRGERAVLERLAAGEELTWAQPGGWWIETDQIAGRIGWALLRKVYIGETYKGGENYIIYTINEWGRNALKGKRSPGEIEFLKKAYGLKFDGKKKGG